MASLLFTIGGALVNAFAFTRTNFLASRFTDYNNGKRKRHDFAEEKTQRAWMNVVRNERGSLILSATGSVKKMRQGHASTMVMRQCLNFIKYLQNE